VKAGKLLLLVVILALGGSLQLAWSVNSRFDIGPAGCRVLRGKFYGPSFAFESEAREPVPAGTPVAVDNSFGKVRVSAGAGGEVHAKLRTVVYAPTEKQAREFAAQVRLEAALDGSSFKVSTNRNGIETPNIGFETNFEIEVPADTPLSVANEHGAVDVSGVASAKVESSYDELHVGSIAGNVDLKSRHADVEAADIKGTLVLSSRYGEVDVKQVAGHVSIDSAHGDVAVNGAAGLRIEAHYGDLTIGKIQGDLEVTNEHGGVQAAEVKGGATITTSYEGIGVSKLGGEARLKTEHGEIRATDVVGALSADASYEGVSLERIGGPVRVKVDHGGVMAQGLEKGGWIQASGEDVSVEGYQGALEIEAKRASVHVAPGKPLVDALSVSAANGGIHLEVPGGSKFDIAATAQSGEISVDLAGLVLSETSPTNLVGKMGGGGRLVKLQTDHGDVSLSALSEVAAKDQD
jgi:DUF4097 and DUF4098 domain-containing protein YvlB